MQALLIASIAALVAGAAAPINAQTVSCDPNEILRSDTVSYQENLEVFLSYLQTYEGKTDSTSETGVGLSYAGVGLSLSDARGLSQFISSSKKYALSKSHSISILKSTLSDKSVEAYMACLNQPYPVRVRVPTSALEGNVEEFIVNVVWKPEGVPEPEAEAVVTITGATVDKERFTVRPNENTPLVIKRDIKSPLFLYVKIAGAFDLVELPKKPDFELKVREIIQPPLLGADGKPGPEVSARSGGDSGTNPVEKRICVTKSNDGALLPDTLVFKGRVYGDPKRARMDTAPDNSIFNVCVALKSSTGAKEVANEIVGRISVFEAYLETTVPPNVAAPPSSVPNIRQLRPDI